MRIVVILFVLFLTGSFGAFAKLHDELPVNWAYKKIFLASEIPAPESSVAYGGNVRAIYSPSVIKIDGKYLMFFGVSVFCANNSVARDSIALAESTNGFDWVFKKYIIEPDPGMCWRKGGDYVFQLNDPSVSFDPNDPNTILVFYTTVRSTRDNFGNIGLAKFDRQLNLKSRNDLFLQGTTVITGGGFSRPSVNWLETGGPRLYFDSSAKLASVALTNLTDLNGAVVRNENVAAIDVHTPAVSKTETLLLSGGGVAMTRDMDKLAWNPAWLITKVSGQGWDYSSQGSPELFIDDGCKPRIYVAGVHMNAAGNDYVSINIGMAYPTDDKTFAFDTCNKCGNLTVPVLNNPKNNQVVQKGVEVKFSWDIGGDTEIASQDICISTNQTSCDVMSKTVGPGVNFVTATINNTDDLITWSVGKLNKCGKSMIGYGSFKSVDTTFNVADYNSDGKVDLVDFGIWKVDYLAGRSTLVEFGVWKSAYLK